jgi:hypothetical protein
MGNTHATSSNETAEFTNDLESLYLRTIGDNDDGLLYSPSFYTNDHSTMYEFNPTRTEFPFTAHYQSTYTDTGTGLEHMLFSDPLSFGSAFTMGGTGPLSEPTFTDSESFGSTIFMNGIPTNIYSSNPMVRMIRRNGDNVFNNAMTSLLDQLFSNLFSSAASRSPVDTTTFSTFPKKKYSEITSPDKCTECTICKSDMSDDTEVTVLPCSHFFDPACIERWMTEYHRSCPICRREY